ncbi:hypothetical protein [Cupriavidus consociatus]|uniref:hypothetical protein n=1 Tax=Cupriavidus consociatus TaxID=2821357 RepID=UPI001AE17F73|nr:MULTISPECIES: hypothetical protein [unclassified Cupriavidus]MBP0622436.1 hypothetical protein [Cupriavidus sp. LEh25]MDK2659123.1 hypothetical protein [Cupriavidus sp. LEh21]
MLEKKRSYKGFHVALFVPELIEQGKPNGRVQISAGNEDIGIRFTPDWSHPPATQKEAEDWLFAYAAGIIDCELAGGFGIDLRNE